MLTVHKVLDNEPENEITITVFRMLVLDLLAMFHVMNQAMINILGMELFQPLQNGSNTFRSLFRNVQIRR